MNKSTRTINVFLKNCEKRAKQTYYQSILKDCQNDMTHTWKIMKEITEKVKLILTDFLSQ